ncbi:MAG: sugar phosphate isomerase/epimerase family protein, partial [Pirellulales bacterium]
EAGVKLLCDLFHMNIEEAAPAETLREVGSLPGNLIGHVHWADSNRRAMGLGHTDARAAYAALQTSGYEGFLAAEVFPLPSADEAACQTIASLKKLAAG